MLTHDGFKSKKWVRALFLILGAMAFAGSKPEDWAAVHIKHHAHSDEEGDPHSPLDGFLHAHLGWMYKEEQASPSVYAPHLLADPVVMFVSRYTYLWGFLGFLIPFLIGGWTGLIWGGGVRFFITTHATWSVNSICHVFGKRDFETTDESRNEWVVGMLAFGEGWHNNHHAFPRNAYHGLRWYQIDMSGWIIKGMEKLGLVWDVQSVSQEVIQAHRIRTESLQEHIQDLRSQLTVSIEDAKKQFMGLIERFGTPKVADHEFIEAAKTCEASLKRLNDIQQRVSKAAHLKKQKLQVYLTEVQRLCEDAKHRAARLVVVQPS